MFREFWQSQADNDDVALFTDDAILELRAGDEQKQFDILLVHRFKHIGRTAFESPFAACFFDKTGIEVWAGLFKKVDGTARSSRQFYQLGVMRCLIKPWFATNNDRYMLLPGGIAARHFYVLKLIP